MVSKIARGFLVASLMCTVSAWLVPQAALAYTAGIPTPKLSFISAAYGDSAQSTNQMIANNIPSLFFASYSPVLGNPKGKVVLTTFMDYQCGYCKKQSQAVLAALAHDKDLRVVVKEFPVLGPASVHATRAALAAKEQGKYAQMHAALMSTTMPLTEHNVLMIAQSLHLNMEQLQRDMQSEKIDTEIQRNEALARKLGISVTPAMIVAPTPTYGRSGWNIPFNAITFAMGYSGESGVQRALNKAHQAHVAH